MNTIYQQAIDWLYIHRRGTMGTIIFHLLLLILFLSMEISKIQQHNEPIVLVEAPAKQEIVKKIEEKERREEVAKKATDEEYRELLKSMAVNEDARPKKETSKAKVESYIQEMEQEIDRSKYGNKYKKKTAANFAADSMQHLRDRKKQELDSLKSTFYSGKSSVSYSLKDRFARNLPIPVFKCLTGGTVVVLVGVNQQGKVVEAKVDTGKSVDDEALHDVGRDAALRSVFNAKASAPAIQWGTITYRFVKQ